MPEATTRHVFVYGTLRRGGRNDINRLLPSPRLIGAGAVQGVLYVLGWYPGLVLGGAQSGPVVGEVYAIGPELERELDRIEEIRPGDPDSEYFRREVPVDMADGAVVCLVYEINPDRVHGRQVIASGDWMEFHKA